MTHKHTHLPVEGLDAEVVPLVAAPDKVDAGEAREGLQATVDDGQLAGGCIQSVKRMKTILKWNMIILN